MSSQPFKFSGSDKTGKKAIALNEARVKNIEEHKRKEHEAQFAASIFPPDQIHPLFMEYVGRAMMVTSIVRVGCHRGTWENLITFEREFFYPEIKLGLDLMRTATPKEMEQTLGTNLSMIKEVVEPMYKTLQGLSDDIWSKL